MQQHLAPFPFLRPYVALARLRYPTGYLLLFLPCLWGLLAASPTFPPPAYIVAFFVGAVVMRSAGCTYNDMVDENIDRHVARTAWRPLAAGDLSRKQAGVFLGLQLILGLGVLLYLPQPCWKIACASLVLVAAYPWMKRVTYWPQFFLGLTFNGGVFVGWVSLDPVLSTTPFLLYGAGIFWTLAYDTIYAFQDLQDDIRIGVKSTARKFQFRGKSALYSFYAFCWALLTLAGIFASYTKTFFIMMLIGTVGTFYGTYRLDITPPLACQHAFQKNVWVGIWVAMALAVRYY